MTFISITVTTRVKRLPDRYMEMGDETALNDILKKEKLPFKIVGKDHHFAVGYVNSGESPSFEVFSTKSGELVHDEALEKTLTDYFAVPRRKA
jgi:hypothetical protein